MKTAAAPGKPGRLTSALSSWPRALLGALHHYRFALLWAGHSAACLLLLARILTEPDTPYVITDILTNNAGGLVRRGFGGDIMLTLSATFGGAPALWAWGLVSMAATLLNVLVIRLYRRLPDDPAFLILILAPSGLLFFAYDHQMTLRKELFGFIAIALVLSAASMPRPKVGFFVLTLLAAVIFVLSLFVHEPILLLWPAYVLALGLAGFIHPGARLWLVMLAIGTLVLGLAAIWYLVNLPAPNVAAICDAAGVRDCHLYNFLIKGAGEGLTYMLSRRTLWHIPVFFGYLALGLLPFAFVRVSGLTRVQHLAVVLILLVAVSPLFVIAFDWGRWIYMVLLPLNLLVATAIGLGYARFENPVPAWANILYLVAWALPHAHAEASANALFLLVALAVFMAGNVLLRRATLRP